MQIDPMYFGFLGSAMTVLFLASVYYWAEFNARAERAARNAAKWTMVGNALFLIGAWFVCGILSYPGRVMRPEQANFELAIPTSYAAMALIALGFAFMFIGQRKACLAQGVAKP